MIALETEVSVCQIKRQTAVIERERRKGNGINYQRVNYEFDEVKGHKIGSGFGKYRKRLECRRKVCRAL